MNELVGLKSQAETVESLNPSAGVEDSEALAPVQDELDQFLDSMYSRNREHRKQSGIDDKILSCSRAFLGEYSPEKLSEIKEADGSTVYVGLTGTKCRAGIAWLLDIFSSEEDKTWGLKHTPDPDISPTDEERIVTSARENLMRRVQQISADAEKQGVPEDQALSPDVIERLRADTFKGIKEAYRLLAVSRAKGMEIKIQDQLLEGKWGAAFNGFIWDLVTNKAGIIKGPILRTRKRKRWVMNPETGRSEMDVQLMPSLTFERVAPVDAYPSPQAVDFDSDFFERVRYTKKSLQDVMGVEGFDTISLMAVIQDFDALGAPSMRAEDRDQAEIQGKDTQEADQVRDTVEGYEAWVCVTGKLLRESGLTMGPDGVTPVDDFACYDVTVIKIKEHRIFFSFNPDPLGRKPYYKQGWSKIPGSFWYQSVVELMDELQLIANGSMRALANNMVLTSGPQVAIHDYLRVHNTDVRSIFPMKIWQFSNRMNSTLPPIQFFQPEARMDELMKVYDKMSFLADTWSGIPAYEYGTPSASAAGRTSSGLGMLMSSAARGIKRVVLDIDLSVFKPAIEAIYDYNMATSEDPDIMGDMEVVATGAVQVLAKEALADRRLQFLQATSNEMDFKVMGHKGRARLLSAAAEPLSLLGEPLAQTEEALDEQLAQEREEQAQARQAESKNVEDQKQMEGAKLDLERADLELRRQELDLKVRELEEVKTPVAGAKMVSEQERLQDSSLRTYLQASQPKQKGGKS